jgi:halimadienyl-diphosphate synthase
MTTHTVPPPKLPRQIRRMLREPAVTRISPSAYDTAAIATLRAKPGSRELLLPSAARWLLANQWPDGSWGGSIPTPHDRATSTLAAVVALAELARAVPPGFPDVSGRISDGVDRIWQLSQETRPGDPRETIGFEFVLPALLDKARALQLRLPFGDFGWVQDLYDRKMRAVPAAAFHRVTTLVHSLEAFAGRWPRSALPALQAPDGSFGCSPAATVAGNQMLGSPSSMAYFATALRATGEGAAPVVFPFRTFDDGWTFHALARAGVAPARLRPHVARLARGDPGRPFGVSEGLPPDADDTGTVLPVLAGCGYPVDLGALREFETTSGYLTFELERGFSASTNVHVLGALKLDQEGMAKQIEVVLQFLRDHRAEGAYWRDKWHLSPYYTTCDAIPALHGLDDELCADAVRWVLATQHADGSWGLAGGTLEETGYALNALMAVSAAYPQAWRAVHRGIRFLRERWDPDGGSPHPPLWIGKVLYTPYRVVEAAVAGAVYHYMRLMAQRGAVPK